MKLSRPSRFVAALIALFSILFMQLAVAAYVCPDFPVGQTDKPVSISVSSLVHDTSDCQGMDIEQANLCDAHDQAGTQSLDKPGLPQVQSFVAIGTVIALPSIEATYRAPAAQSTPFSLTRTTAPPLAIRNCCFRI
jgi:hypothetical protein